MPSAVQQESKQYAMIYYGGSGDDPDIRLFRAPDEEAVYLYLAQNGIHLVLSNWLFDWINDDGDQRLNTILDDYDVKDVQRWAEGDLTGLPASVAKALWQLQNNDNHADDHREHGRVIEIDPAKFVALPPT